ncbi:MAG: heat-inducible transcription repressor HrcA [Solirubrobacterales bacterium]|nr:heat-inducible transcription repressor HrcA [Solirubrobacterales bacterium]
MLTERQELILDLAVEAYLKNATPVGSRAIAEGADFAWSPSTVRSELAALALEGYLTHPHTSAGRVPTDAGYRRYADDLIESRVRPSATVTVPGTGLSQVRREVEEALRETTAALAQANDLLALATAPPASTATIHRIEVLRLQSRVVAVVAIADNGDVAKRVFTFESPVDSGLVEWASSFLNEKLSGLGIGSRAISARLDDPDLGEQERRFLGQIGEAVAELAEASPQELYMDGTARLLSETHAADIPHPDGVVRALEGRVSVLSVLRSALRERSVFLCIGEENPEPALRSMSMVSASYGLGYRNLGAVGVVGPLRMDYARAIDSVRDAAGELSRFFATVYEG